MRLPHADEITGIMERQRLPQHGIDHAEHGRAAANANGERQDRGDGEGRCAAQRPPGQSEVQWHDAEETISL